MPARQGQAHPDLLQNSPRRHNRPSFLQPTSLAVPIGGSDPTNTHSKNTPNKQRQAITHPSPALAAQAAVAAEVCRQRGNIYSQSIAAGSSAEQRHCCSHTLPHSQPRQPLELRVMLAWRPHRPAFRRCTPLNLQQGEATRGA